MNHRWLKLKSWVEAQEKKDRGQLIPIARFGDMMRALDVAKTEDEWILGHFEKGENRV